MAFQRGRRLAIDVGSVRVGVATCDPDGILATPVETVQRGKGAAGTAAALRRIADLVAEYEVMEVICGLPRTLRGEHGAAVAAATDFAERLAPLIAPVPISFVDERLSTLGASRALREAGLSAKAQRAVIDQAAAVEILTSYLAVARDERSPSA